MADVDVAEDVAELVHLRCVRFQRGLHVVNARKRRVLDRDQRGCCSRLLERLGGDERDRLAFVADDAAGEDRLVAELEPEVFPARYVVREQDGEHAGAPPRRGGVDRADAGGWMRAAQRHPVRRRLRQEVPAVGIGAAYLRLAVDAACARADAFAGGVDADAFGVTTSPRTKADSCAVAFLLGFVSHAASFPASSTASTILR